MPVEVEVFRLETLQYPIIVFVVDKNGAENGFFGVDVMWKSSFERYARHKIKPEIENQKFAGLPYHYF
jgi:hypothetical protein